MHVFLLDINAGGHAENLCRVCDEPFSSHGSRFLVRKVTQPGDGNHDLCRVGLRSIFPIPFNPAQIVHVLFDNVLKVHRRSQNVFLFGRGHRSKKVVAQTINQGGVPREVAFVPVDAVKPPVGRLGALDMVDPVLPHTAVVGAKGHCCLCVGGNLAVGVTVGKVVHYPKRVAIRVEGVGTRLHFGLSLGRVDGVHVFKRFLPLIDQVARPIGGADKGDAGFIGAVNVGDVGVFHDGLVAVVTVQPLQVNLFKGKAIIDEGGNVVVLPFAGDDHAAGGEGKLLAVKPEPDSDAVQGSGVGNNLGVFGQFFQGDGDTGGHNLAGSLVVDKPLHRGLDIGDGTGAPANDGEVAFRIVVDRPTARGDKRFELADGVDVVDVADVKGHG